MKKFFILPMAALGFAAPLHALDVTPGNLCEVLGSDAATVTTLTLTGSADARDLHFAAQLPALRSLDMSGLQIVGVQSDTAIMLSRYQYPVNVLPAYIFALSKLETVTLPSTLTVIEECAFASAKNLRTVTLPASLRSIGDWAFYGTALTSVTLPAADTLGTGIFAECGKLAEARLSAAKVTTLPAKTFRGCTALRTVTFPAAMSALGDESLLGSGLEVLDLPSGIKEIGAYAASSMPLLGSYTATNPKLMDGAISFNPYLNKITGQEDLGRLSLAHSPALVLDSATTAGFATIGEYALADNPGQRLWFNDKLTSVGNRALDGMLNLISIRAVEVEGAVPAAATGAFDGLGNISNIRLWVLKDNLSAWQADPEWGRFMLIGTDASTPGITADQGLEINAVWQDDQLIVTAGQELVTVSVFSTSGSILAVSAPRATEAILDLGDVADKIIVVRATTASGARTFKLRKV